MSIRYRTTLIIFFFVAVIVAGLFIANRAHDRLLQEENASASITQTKALWKTLVESNIQRIYEHSDILRANERLRVVLASGNRDMISDIGLSLFRRMILIGDDHVNRLDLVNIDGEVVFSSSPAFELSTPVQPLLVRKALDENLYLSGIGNDSSRNITLSLLIPLYGINDEPLAVAILSSAVVFSLQGLRDDGVTEALIINRRGRLLVGTDLTLWKDLGAKVDLAGELVQEVRGHGGRVFSVKLLPFEADLGNIVATLLVLRDVSQSAAQLNRLEYISLALIGLFLVLAMFGISFYLNRALSPLALGAEILNALARGDTSAADKLEVGRGSDELSRIGHAINAFRVQTITLRRQRDSRERWRHRQEEFIRSEMIRLGNTLTGEARDDVHTELAQIESEMRRHQEESLQEQDSEIGREDDSGALGLQLTGFAFKKMTDRVAIQQEELTNLIADLQQALKTRRALVALQRDLEIAARVQLSFLPGGHYKKDDIEIRATMVPARDVGGDFYDFFELGEHRIGVVIADVAGKGVPAALFMAVARTLIRAVAMRFVSNPADCLETVNEMLVDSSRENVFVTVFYGVYDRRDGSFIYANGGHNPPMLVADGVVTPLPLTNGALLAMFSGLKYKQHTIKLPAGGKLFFYTDGVTESIDENQTEFSDKRMIEVLEKGAHSGPNDTIETMLLAVDKHAEKAEQFDDITMVVLSHEPPEDKLPVARITIRNDLAELPRLAEKVETFCELNGIAMADMSRMQLVLDEAITNTINYAYPEGGRHEIQIRIARDDEMIDIRIEDQGQKFDPFADAKKPDFELSIEDREIGGLGVHFVRELMDEFYYERVGPRNRMVLRKKVALK